MKQFDYSIEREKQILENKENMEYIENMEYLEDRLRSKNFIKLNAKWLRGIMNNE